MAWLGGSASVPEDRPNRIQRFAWLRLVRS